MRQSGAASQKAPTSTSSPRSTTDAQSEVDDLVWITSEDIDDYTRSMTAFEKVSCLHKPRLEDLDSLFRYLREDHLGKMKAKDFISIFINVYAESLSLWADLDYVIGKLKPNSTISRRQAEIFRAIVQIGDFIHQIPGEGQEWDAEVEPSTPMAAVEHLKKMVDSVKAMTRTAWLNLKPLPQLPTDDNASFLDESDQESVYYDAPEGRLSVLLVAQTDNTLAEFRYPFAPPATSTQIIHRKEPSFHTPSVSMSSTSCHTKVNSVSTTSTAATHCNSLPLEVVFNELGIGMVVAGEVKRGLAQQFKAKAAKSMVSLLSTSTKKAASTIEFPDPNAYAESTVSSKKRLKGSLYRLKQFGNSKVSLFSPIKAKKSPAVTKLEGHALLPEWMHDDGGFLETEDFTMIRQSLVNYPDWDQCSPSLQELLPAPKGGPSPRSTTTPSVGSRLAQSKA
ncbi:hypothetical protein DFP72DRAFT_233525 [Ephemerocybe angulata]|uniref:Uncharacterized protein n=1 Tax=Ephemerocybe angulata TaxID=980116 RepID=A0A8H6I1X7_9AGAR|nr:hypothetical protein DFP72DRAFT_233525 [Tulosesus angulatus]